MHDASIPLISLLFCLRLPDIYANVITEFHPTIASMIDTLHTPFPISPFFSSS